MSAGSLFHTVTAATAKALVPVTVFVHCTTKKRLNQAQKVKGQLAGGGGILWRPPAQLFIAVIIVIHSSVGHLSLRVGDL